MLTDKTLSALTALGFVKETIGATKSGLILLAIILKCDVGSGYLGTLHLRFYGCANPQIWNPTIVMILGVWFRTRVLGDLKADMQLGRGPQAVEPKSRHHIGILILAQGVWGP